MYTRYGYLHQRVLFSIWSKQIKVAEQTEIANRFALKTF